MHRSHLVCGLDKLRMRKLLRLFVHQLLRQVNVLLVGHHLGLAMMVVRLHIFNMPGYLVHQLKTKSLNDFIVFF